MFTIGIDPGSNGAIAVLDSLNPDSIALLDLKKHSIFEISSWLTSRYKNIEYEEEAIVKIWVEDIHSMYGMSARSNFGFGRNLGIVLTISEMLTGVTPGMVAPKVWQKYIGVTAKGKAIKRQVANIAQYLYPQAELHGKKGGLLDGRSDALMIAYYGLHNKEKV
tara:strand:+ start:138 stop:629 length:492 start_codon:yes stop_codon:yes gene_type:complete